MKTGKIIIGYQGIGKTTTCQKNKKYIDLESSLFKNEDGLRFMGWEYYYVKVAFSLANQGHNVFISSHSEVRKLVSQFRTSLYPDIEIIVIYPHPEVKKKWLDLLQHRQLSEPTDKNRFAYLNACQHYEDNIKDLHNYAITHGYTYIIIQSPGSLDHLIDKLDKSIKDLSEI